MTIVGFGFTKLNVERKGVAKGKISIKNNINVKNVTSTDLSLGKNKEIGLVFTFEFKSNYEPDIADINIEGEIIYLAESKKVKEVLDKWKKSSKVEGDLLGEVLNTALSKSNIQALIMSRDINIPAPFPLPKVGIKKQE